MYLDKQTSTQYLYNGSGDVVQLLQGSNISYYSYDDQGRTNIVEGYGYRGEYHEEGYQYLRFRYLDLDSSRFMSKDSYLGNEDPTSQNRYTYVGNNPVNYGDPSGHKRFPGFSPVIPKMIEENIINPVIEEQEHQVATEVARIAEEIKEVAGESEGFRSESPQQLNDILIEATKNGATPEEKAELIRKYCEDHNLDD